MNSKLWIRKALTLCLMVAVVGTYSMVAFANDGKGSGELIVTGNGNDTSYVMVNGEASKTGRTIFSSSTISTSEGIGAIINMGKTGRVELAPNTTVTLAFDNDLITGDLVSGNLTVLSSAKSVNLTKQNGDHLVLNPGETASTDPVKPDDDYRDSTGKCIDANKNGKLECDKGVAWWVFALVFAGGTIGIIEAATNHNNTNLGGGTTVISPTR